MARPLFTMAWAWLWWDELNRARAAFETLRSQAAEFGDESSLAYVLVMGAQIDCVSGDVQGAIRYADEGLALTEQAGQATVGAYVLALRALADAIAGDVDAGRERADRALSIAARTNGRPAEHFARAALGLLEQSVGRPGEVVRALGPLVDFLRAERIAEPGAARVVPDQVEALIALGDAGGGRGAARLVRGERAAAGPSVRAGRSGTLPRAARRRARGRRGRPRRTAGRTRAAPRASRFRSSWHGRGSPTAPPCAAHGRRRPRARRWRPPHDGFKEARSACVGPARAEAELGRVGGRPPSSGALTPTERRSPSWSPKGSRPSRSPAALYVSPKTSKATSHASTASWASARAPSWPTASAKAMLDVRRESPGSRLDLLGVRARALGGRSARRVGELLRRSRPQPASGTRATSRCSPAGESSYSTRDGTRA